jgi:hypothetical protein
MEGQANGQSELEVIVKEDAIITKELEAYNTTRAEITEASARYMLLTAEKDGLDVIHAARMDFKGRRINVTKAAEKLRAGAIAFQKRVIVRQKDLISLMAPTETHLDEEENRIEEEKARLKAEEEAKIAARTKARVDRLIKMGCAWNGTEYVYGVFALPMALITTCEDEQFNLFCGKIQEVVDKKKAEEAAEQERLAKVAEEEAKKKAEAEAEQKRVKAEQDRVAAEQETERKRLAAEAKKIEDEKARLENERKAKEEAEAKERELEKARVDGKKKGRQDLLAEIAYNGPVPDLATTPDEEWLKFYRARKEEYDAAQREKIEAETTARLKAEADAKKAKEEAEAKAKADKEEKARLAAERKEKRRPDKEKLESYIEALQTIPMPAMKTDEGKAARADVEAVLATLWIDLQSRVAQL